MTVDERRGRRGGRGAPPAHPVLSLRAYARRRGVSPEAVSKAIQVGRLRESVVRVRGAPKIRDPDLADREWAASTDLTRAAADIARRADRPAGEPGAGDDLVLSEELAREKHWKANLAELEYRERKGELVEAKDVAKKLTDIIAICRGKLLGIPTRLRQSLPHLSVQDVAKAEELVREALEDLAGMGEVTEVEGDELAPQPAAAVEPPA